MKDILKKNILSIICGVVAIVAIVASFVPLGGYKEALQADLDKSKSTHGTLEGLVSKTRQKPVVNPDATASEPLGTFPNEQVIEAGKKLVTQVEAESRRMRDVAVEMNRAKKQPLVPGSLPAPSPAMTIAFREAYTKLFQVAQPGELPLLAKQAVNGGVPPTDQQVALILAEETKKIQAENTVMMNNQIVNGPEIQEMVADRQRKLPDELRQKVADSHPIYVAPNAFDVNPKIVQLPPGARPVEGDIWWSQVQLWVQQDVLAALAEANAGKKSVKEAPVKQLFSIKVPPNFIAGAPSAPGQPVADPMGGNPDAAVPKVTTVSPSGRVSNALYDVVHFDMVVDVETQQIGNFIRELADKRLITVREMNVGSVDSAAELAKGYIYGSAPVSRLTMKCEALLMRNWTRELMPQSVKTLLGVQDPPAGAAPAAAPTAMAQ
jgi:hypothetical protein